MIKLKDLIKEDYVVTIEDRKGKLIQKGSFTRKEDAKLYIKDMIKKHKLKRQKGFWGNPKTGVELTTNFQDTMIKLKDILSEAKYPFDKVKVGTKIYYQMGVVYTVSQVYPGGFLMRMTTVGNNPGMFAPKARIEKDNFISQVKVGLIKGIEQ